ncbi:MAG: site-specific integrase [Gammaproteobacteria bacterium]|nr:site-specific integrase [Gammaproteobacteria bacterium]
MATKRLNKSFVDTLSTPAPGPGGKKTQRFFRDSALPGFGLRITSGGAKSFIVEKRIAGKVKRITLGRYGHLTVEQARIEAQKLLGEVATGKDPIKEKQAKRARGVTLKEAFDSYLQTRKDLKPLTIHDYTRSIEGPFKDWQNRALANITKDMVELRHRELGQRSPARANNAMRLLRAIFNHAQAKYEDENGNPIITVNPIDRISQNRGWYEVKPRQTLIKAHQLGDWYAATEQLNNQTTQDYLRFLLFTGLRRSEAAGLKWNDLDFKDRTFTIKETKNKQIHTLPLSDYLFDLLKRRHDGATSIFVFPSNTARGHMIEPRTAVSRVSELSGVPFTLHDLRRTFITIAESLDIAGYALKRLLNHKDPNDVTAGYIVSNVDRLREPMQRITDFIVEHCNDKNSEETKAC